MRPAHLLLAAFFLFVALFNSPAVALQTTFLACALTAFFCSVLLALCECADAVPDRTNRQVQYEFRLCLEAAK